MAKMKTYEIIFSAVDNTDEEVDELVFWLTTDKKIFLPVGTNVISLKPVKIKEGMPGVDLVIK